MQIFHSPLGRALLRFPDELYLLQCMDYRPLEVFLLGVLNVWF